MAGRPNADAGATDLDTDSDDYDSAATGFGSNVDLVIVDATYADSTAAGGRLCQRVRVGKASLKGDRPRASMDTKQTGASTSSKSSKNPIKQINEYRETRRDLHRKHRGLMYWKPMRNTQFAMDEATFAVRRIMKAGSLNGHEPDVEMESRDPGLLLTLKARLDDTDNTMLIVSAMKGKGERIMNSWNRYFNIYIYALHMQMMKPWTFSDIGSFSLV